MDKNSGDLRTGKRAIYLLGCLKSIYRRLPTYKDSPDRLRMTTWTPCRLSRGRGRTRCPSWSGWRGRYCRPPRGRRGERGTHNLGLRTVKRGHRLRLELFTNVQCTWANSARWIRIPRRTLPPPCRCPGLERRSCRPCRCTPQSGKGNEAIHKINKA